MTARMRLNTPKKSGSAGGSAARKWLYYDALHFLQSCNTVRRGIDNMDKVMHSTIFTILSQVPILVNNDFHLVMTCCRIAGP